MSWGWLVKDEEKTREQLIDELASLRESLRECTAALQARTQDLDDVAHYVVSEFKRPLGLIIGLAKVLEEDWSALSDEEMRLCIQSIKQGGHKMGKMVNALLLLANSRRLFDNVWYSAYLAAMDEPSLPQWVHDEAQSVREAYRFTCLPTFSAPFIVRVWETEGEPPSFRAIAKFGSWPEEGNESVVVASQETEWALPAEEWHALLVVVEKSRFWTDGASLERLGWIRMMGTDSEEWVFEGWRGSEHRIRVAWSPDGQKAPAVYALGRSFVKLLPETFALGMARWWATGVESDTHARFRDMTGLSSLL
jgi:hypothetical protein